MPLMTLGPSHLMARDGKLLTSRNCCCDGQGDCAVYPETIYAHVNWGACGTSVIELTELSGSWPECSGPQPEPGLRRWRGSGQFGGGNTAIIGVYCGSDGLGGTTLFYKFDGCTGFLACPTPADEQEVLDPSTASPFGFFEGVPPAACDNNCLESWTVTLKDTP